MKRWLSQKWLSQNQKKKMKLKNNSNKDFAFEGTQIPAGGESNDLPPELAGRLLALYWHNPLEPIEEASKSGDLVSTKIEAKPVAEEENTMSPEIETPDVETPETPAEPVVPVEPEEESEIEE